MIAEPQDPKCLPNNPARHDPITDKNTNSKYIPLNWKKWDLNPRYREFLYKDLADLRYKPLSHFSKKIMSLMGFEPMLLP